MRSGPLHTPLLAPLFTPLFTPLFAPLLSLLVVGLLFCRLAEASATPLQLGSAQALKEAQAQVAPRLARDPVVLDSIETSDGLQGDVFATVAHSLDDVRAALVRAGSWCEMLRLHINNRRCVVAREAEGAASLTLSVVRRYDQPVDSAFVLSFDHRTLESSPQFLSAELTADEGPLGTRRYRVVLEAIPAGEHRTFLHFGYAFEHNMMARMATTAYLATFGRHKRGFTVIGRQADGQPDHIRGLRGLVERNAMRYFLALDAHLAGIDALPPQRLDRRLNRWFDGVERYPAQLGEVDRTTYLALKAEDRRREREGGGGGGEGSGGSGGSGSGGGSGGARAPER